MKKDLYIVIKEEDYEVLHILFITDSFDEAKEKADFYFTDSSPVSAYEHYLVMKYKEPDKTIYGFWCDNCDKVYDARTKEELS